MVASVYRAWRRPGVDPSRAACYVYAVTATSPGGRRPRVVRPRRPGLGPALSLGLAALALALLLGGCGEQQPHALVGTSGDPRAGLSVYKMEGCAQCHSISGVSVGVIGPVLDGEGTRRTAAWLRAMLAPHAHAVGDAALNPRDHEDLVAYLASL